MNTNLLHLSRLLLATSVIGLAACSANSGPGNDGDDGTVDPMPNPFGICNDAMSFPMRLTSIDACPGCTVTDPDNVIDDDLGTAATISIPLGAGGMGASITVTAEPLPLIPAGTSAGIFVDPSEALLGIGLGQSFIVDFLADGEVVDTAAGPGIEFLQLSALDGILGLLIPNDGSDSGIRVAFPTSAADYDSVRLTLAPGVLTLGVEEMVSGICLDFTQF